MQEKKLLMLAGEELSKFQRMYGVKQTQNDLKATVTVKYFRSFFEDYTEKFEIIHGFLVLHVKWD